MQEACLQQLDEIAVQQGSAQLPHITCCTLTQLLSCTADMGHVLEEPLQLVVLLLPGNKFCKTSVVAKSLLFNAAEQAFQVYICHFTNNAADRKTLIFFCCFAEF